MEDFHAHMAIDLKNKSWTTETVLNAQCFW